jgi:outer membrane receptor for Fe3+-dicitrate
MNASVGYTFVSRGVVFRPQLFVDNIFDLKYSLKGTFFSGATFGKPRTFQLRMSVGI